MSDNEGGEPIKRFPQLFTVTESITPKKAAEYLLSNFGNRTISKAKVEKHKRAIAAGRFRHTHQGIAFDCYGNLKDGQHRLKAIAEGEVAVTMQVTRGVDADSFSAIDTEMRVRSVADALRMTGNYSATKQTIAICNLWMFMRGLRAPGQFEIEDFLNVHTEAIEFALSVGLNHPHLKHACILTMIAIAFEAGHGDDIRDWAEVVKSGEITEPWQTSALRFRDYWLTSRHSGGAALRVEYCQRIYASMSAWVERRGLAKLYAKQSIGWIGLTEASQ